MYVIGCFYLFFLLIITYLTRKARNKILKDSKQNCDKKPKNNKTKFKPKQTNKTSTKQTAFNQTNKQ